MKKDAWKIVSETCGKGHEALDEDAIEEEYSDKEKGTLKSAFGKAKGKSQVQRKKIIKKAFGKVSG